MVNHEFNNEKINKLVDEILEIQMHPFDTFEIAAILESIGWNDQRATKELGVENIFKLANQIWELLQQKNVIYTPTIHYEKPTRIIGSIEIFRTFLRGLIFAFPMAVSVIAMLNLKFSLWSYKYLAVEQATSIAIGTIISFIVVGGFTQAIARRGFFYIIQDYYSLAKKSTFQFIWIGYVLCVILSLLMVILNIIFNMFTYQMILLIVVFFFFLTSIWLSVTVMYILRKEIIFTGLIILGICFVYIFFVVFNIDILLSQLISLFIVSILSLLLVLYFFIKSEKKEEKAMRLKLPKFTIILYSIWPYFTYGFLYFAFLFVDRVNAWSKNEEFMPYVIWFRGNYELGLDFALLTLIIPMGLSEVIVSRLMNEIEFSQKEILIEECDKLYRKFLISYWRKYVIIFIGSLGSAFIIYRLLIWYNNISIQLNGEDLLASKVTVFVLIWGIISYIILSFCLMNTVILFALSQPYFVIKALIPSLLVNVLTGFLFSRWLDYEYAVLGLFIGSVLMMVLSTRYLLKVMKNLDYYLYASF